MELSITMKVKYNKTGDIVNIPDTIYNSNDYTQIGGQNTQIGGADQGQDSNAEMRNQYQKLVNILPQIKDQNAIAQSYKIKTGEDLFAVPKETAQTPQQKTAQYKSDVIGLAKGLQNVIKNKSKYSLEEYRAIKDSLTSTLTIKQKEAANFGASLTANELAILAGQIPVRQEIGQSAIGWIKQMLTGKKPIQTGEVVDSDEMIKRKLSILVPTLEGKEISPEVFKKVTKTEPSLGQFGQNIRTNAKDILNSILGLPKQGIDYTMGEVSKGHSINALSLLGAAGVNLGTGYAKELYQVAGEPLQGGDIAGRIGQRAYEKPVQTILDLLPFLGVLKGRGKVSETPPTKVVPPESGLNPLQKFAAGSSEIVTGGGPKEFIAKNVNLDQAKTMSETSLKYKIAGKATEKGKIVQTQQALTDVGSSLEKTYKASPVTWVASDLTAGLKQAIIKQFGGGSEVMRAANETVNTITQRGRYNLPTGENMLSATDVWNTAKAGSKYGKSAFNIPKSGPLMADMAKFTDRYLRQELSSKVPEAVPKLRDYGNLRTIMDDVLKNPEGLSSKGMGLTGMLIKLAVGGVKESSQMLNQVLYNLGGKLKK